MMLLNARPMVTTSSVSTCETAGRVGSLMVNVAIFQYGLGKTVCQKGSGTATTLTGTPKSSRAGSFECRQKFHEITQVAAGEQLPKTLGHPGQAGAARGDFRLLHLHRRRSGNRERKFVGILAPEHAAELLLVLQHHRDAVEARRDLLVGQHNRFEYVVARLLLADLGEIGADFAAFAFHLVAAEALRVGTLEENLPACFRVTAFERLAPRRQIVVLSAMGFQAVQLFLQRR